MFAGIVLTVYEQVAPILTAAVVFKQKRHKTFLWTPKDSAPKRTIIQASDTYILELTLF